MNPRQLSMMMKKLGIDVEEIEDVQEVVVRTRSKDYIFDKATVSVMTAQGVATWQVSGTPREVAKGSGSPAIQAPAAGSKTSSGMPTSPTTSTSPTPAAPAAGPAISPEDIDMVAQQTGKSKAEAKAALEATGGDLAEAIMKLSES